MRVGGKKKNKDKFLRQVELVGWGGGHQSPGDLKINSRNSGTLNFDMEICCVVFFRFFCNFCQFYFGFICKLVFG